MHHDELLATIEASYNRTDDDVGRMKSALRAVVELHKPTLRGRISYFDKLLNKRVRIQKYDCLECKKDRGPANYPCPTIQAITEQLG